MTRPKSGTNPFYVLLVFVGIAFVVNVFAFALMTYQAVQPTATTNGLYSGHPLWRLLDAYGNQMLGCELAALAVLTVAAIGTDRFWSRRREKNRIR